MYVCMYVCMYVNQEKEDKEKDSTIPTGMLNLVAPELIFGDEPTIYSTMYVCGTIVTQILTGKHLIKVMYVLYKYSN